MWRATYRDDGTTTGSSRVWSATDDILSGKQPVSPAEAPNVVQSFEEEDGGLGVLDGKVASADFFGFGIHVGEEFTVG